MKEKEQSFLRALAGFFTRYWGLKLLALALAILVYHTIKPTGHPTRTFHDRQLIQNK